MDPGVAKFASHRMQLRVGQRADHIGSGVRAAVAQEIENATKVLAVIVDEDQSVLTGGDRVPPREHRRQHRLRHGGKRR